MRINVIEEGSDKVLWYKERFLSDDEIVEHIVDNPTSTICWTIHRPKRGWYIRIRAPSFPPGIFIALLPVPKVSPNYTDAAISFACRTNVPGFPSFRKLSTDTDSTLVHSYPPSPPAPSVVLRPPSPTSIDAKLEEISSPQTTFRRSHQSPSQITQFILAPHSSAHIPQPETSTFITRAISTFRNSKPSHSSSFTLCPLLPPATSPIASPDGLMAIQSSVSPASSHHHFPGLAQRPIPLLTFHDRTPILTVRSITGLLEINQTEEKSLGVQTSFWIAVALTYLEFLGERDSYLAAVSD
ncbi:hypothetical protein PILCRDRAFT_2155 [Piloderma croceum F 1598]|uniref:Uncharacterized protein n=1 Tax=Piloderma croceum (strain F 1598) TaxID=765440 RepID=A0A0C3CJG7_PILCF|nr:hypothetical protein PILCRDRAFT_2155 [Piloderma croceum F 1598]